MLFWTPHFSVLDSTFFVLDSTFWLAFTLKIDPELGEDESEMPIHRLDSTELDSMRRDVE